MNAWMYISLYMGMCIWKRKKAETVIQIDISSPMCACLFECLLVSFVCIHTCTHVCIYV